MDLTNVISLAISAIGCATGCAALFQTRQANKLAKTANGTAEKSVGIAEKANKLASDANEISEHANLIAKRSLDACADQTVYQWAAWLDADDSAIIVINDCALEARDVHVVIRYDGQTLADERRVHMAAFGELPLENDLFMEKLQEEAAGLSRSGIIGTPYIRLGIHIVWTSELGVRRTCDCQQGFGYAKRKKVLS